MWIMTSFGILMPSVRPADTVPPGDNRLLQIRSRRMQDLLVLKREYMPDLGDIIVLGGSDYQYRVYCTHEQWAAALAQMSMNIDYTKFKPTTERYHDGKLHNLYNILWGKIFEAFPTGSSYDMPRYTGHIRWAPSMRARDSIWASDYRGFNSTTSRIDEDYSDIIDKWDDEVPPARRPSGSLDHSTCTHGSSKNAKRRCARKWSK